MTLCPTSHHLVSIIPRYPIDCKVFFALFCGIFSVYIRDFDGFSNFYKRLFDFYFSPAKRFLWGHIPPQSHTVRAPRPSLPTRGPSPAFHVGQSGNILLFPVSTGCFLQRTKKQPPSGSCFSYAEIHLFAMLLKRWRALRTSSSESATASSVRLSVSSQYSFATRRSSRA